MPGCRVRVRFAGRLTGGYLLQRAEASEHEGKLAFLERVVSPEPVLSADVFRLARAVADRYGGTLADVLRLAIPPRHAAAEAAAPPEDRRGSGPEGPGPDGPGPEGPGPELPDPGPWARYPAGAFVSHRAGRGPRAARGLVRAARPALAGRDRPGRGRHRGRGARDADRRARRQGPRPGRRRAGQRARPRPARRAWRRASARPSGTAAGSRSRAARSGWWPGPGPPCSPRSPGSAWW